MERPQRTYTPDEVDTILRRALELRGGSDPTNLTHDELLETARELEIDRESLERAIGTFEDEYEMDEARRKWKERRKQKFNEHLRTYLVINAFLLVINLVTSPAYLWVGWVILGWGIGLVFDAMEALNPKDKDVDKGALKLLQKERKERRKEARRQNWHSVADHISKAILSGGNRPRPRYGARDKHIDVQ